MCPRSGVKARWVDPGDLDAANGNRSTGVEVCLDTDYLEEHPGIEVTREIRPPGYKWAGRYARHLGLSPDQTINNCHLLGKGLGGSGVDSRNLATCSRQANAWVRGDGRVEHNMYNFEEQVKRAIDGRQIVYYSVTPQHAGPRTVPVSFEISAADIHADGMPGINLNYVVPNSLYSPSRQQWRNLGIVTHANSPQPIGSMP
ncbi:DNA/RNA non-specific endonuclease [Streptomyces griseoincarnatus]